MKGKLSLLFGVHQFFIHPLLVLFAWIELYRLPNFKELICIIIHDWGLWFCKNLDDAKGENHPFFGAGIAVKLLDRYPNTKYRDLCMLHSRHLSKTLGFKPSKLCYADKLSLKYEWYWFYILRAKISGEIKEYRQLAHLNNTVDKKQTNKEWFDFVRNGCIKIAKEGNPDVFPYMDIKE